MRSKMLYLGIFRLESSKNIVIFKINTFEFAKNELLTYAVSFSIGSTFSKCPGFICSQGLDLGPVLRSLHFLFLA